MPKKRYKKEFSWHFINILLTTTSLPVMKTLLRLLIKTTRSPLRNEWFSYK